MHYDKLKQINRYLEFVRDMAINQLGMKYATEDQIIWYSNNTTNSYVRQYQEVPK